MKGQEWYQEHDIAEMYDDKRFSRGGRFIDRREKEAVIVRLRDVVFLVPLLSLHAIATDPPPA